MNKKPPAPKKCKQCGDRFYPSHSNAEFCSDKCRVYSWRNGNKENDAAVLKRAYEQMAASKKRKRK